MRSKDLVVTDSFVTDSYGVNSYKLCKTHIVGCLFEQLVISFPTFAGTRIGPRRGQL